MALTLLLTFFASSAHAAEDQQEYALKAAFLYNFCQFIDWPSGTFPTNTAPIIIGILGNNPFGSLLSETVEGEVVRGHPIRLAHYRKPEEARACHILFICSSELWRSPNIAETFRGTSVVTVGEDDSFLENGGMIALTAVQNRVRLRINLAAVRSANIGMSSKLLRVADTR